MFRRLPLFALWIAVTAITIALRPAGAQQKPPEFKPAPEVPAMPKALMKLPRTDISRSRFPAVDIHFHGRSLRTPQDYQKTIQMMDEINLAVISDMDGGFGQAFDHATKIGEPYKDRVIHFARLRSPTGAPLHGRWRIYGIGLPDEVLRKVYYANALRHVPAARATVERRLAARL